MATKKKKVKKVKKVKVKRKKPPKTIEQSDEENQMAQTEEEEGELDKDFNPLPTKVQKPIYDLAKATTLIFGPIKIGKTTIANQWPGVWFLATEAGQTWIQTHEPTIIDDWPHFLQICGWIAKTRPKKFGDGKPLRTLVVDTVDLLFKMCFDSVCDELGISSPTELDYGAGWQAIGDEFSRVITKLTKLPYGLIFISHTKVKTIKSRARKVDRIEPDIMATGMRVISAVADIILYCSVKETAILGADGEPTGTITEERIIRCQPESNIIAGDRTGRLPDEIPMSYKELVKYFPKTKQ